MMNRYTSHPFPKIAFKPGFNKSHGHDVAFPQTYSMVSTINQLNWKKSESYLYGVDLFNHGYWFEAHEIWETLWLAQHKESEFRVFIQGLIQLSVALLKKNIGKQQSAQSLALKGIGKLEKFSGVKFGVDIEDLTNSISSFIDNYSKDLSVIVLKNF